MRPVIILLLLITTTNFANAKFGPEKECSSPLKALIFGNGMFTDYDHAMDTVFKLMELRGLTDYPIFDFVAEPDFSVFK
jgi:hypothetical protein